MKTKQILIILAIIALIGSLMWLICDLGWEPFVATIVSISGLIAALNYDEINKRINEINKQTKVHKSKRVHVDQSKDSCAQVNDSEDITIIQR